MITEIEVEDVGVMRHMNEYQVARLRKIKGPNRAIAPLAFGLGLTFQQFRNLSPEQKRAAQEAHNRLTSPLGTVLADGPVPDENRLPQPNERVSEERMVQMGRELLEIKKSLPHGHFGPWIRDKSGITETQARRFMEAAKEADQ